MCMYVECIINKSFSALRLDQGFIYRKILLARESIRVSPVASYYKVTSTLQGVIFLEKVLNGFY